MSYQRIFRLQVQIRQLCTFIDSTNTPHHSCSETPGTTVSTVAQGYQTFSKYGPSDLTHQFIVLVPGNNTLASLKTHILEKYEKLYGSKQKELSILQLRDRNNYDLDEDYMIYEVFSSEDMIHVIMGAQKHTKRSSSKKKPIAEQISKLFSEESVKKFGQEYQNISLPTPTCSSPVLHPERASEINNDSQFSTITPQIIISSQNATKTSKKRKSPDKTTPETQELDTQPMSTISTFYESKNIPTVTATPSSIPVDGRIEMTYVLEHSDVPIQQTTADPQSTSPKKSRLRKPKASKESNSNQLLELPKNSSLSEVDGFRESFDDTIEQATNNSITHQPIIQSQVTLEPTISVAKKPTKERKKPLSSMPSIKNMIIETPVTTIPQVVSTLTSQVQFNAKNPATNSPNYKATNVALQSKTNETDLENEYSSKLFSK